MNIASAITTIFLTMAMVSLAGAISRLDHNILSAWFFIIFFLILRIKMCFDDLLFIKNSSSDKRFKIGFTFGIFSWAFWVIAAVHLNYLNFACIYLAIAFFISTVWILFARKNSFYKAQKFWLITNPIYIFVLISCAIIDMNKSILWTRILFLIIIIIGLLDFKFSKSIDAFE